MIRAAIETAGLTALDIASRAPGLGPPIRQAWRRWGPLPISVSYQHSDLSEPSSVTVIALPVDAEGNVHDAKSLYREVDRRGGDFIVPTNVVVSLYNRSEEQLARSVYLTEVFMEVLSFTPPADALRGRTMAVHQAIMAGGRGHEGSFEVRFRSKAKLMIPVLAQSVAGTGDAPPRLRLDPGRYADVIVHPAPSAPGRYALRFSAELLDSGHRRRTGASRVWTIVVAEHDDWAESYFVVGDSWGRRNGRRAVEATLELRRSVADPSPKFEIPQDRRVAVKGVLAEEAY